jgi:hypothetical protein
MAMKKILMLMLLCLMILPTAVFAEDEAPVKTRQYGMGSQMFTFRAGPVIPAFFYRPLLASGDKFLAFPSEMRMKVGGYGSIRYQGFLNSTLALGGELGYYFAYDIGDELFTSVPFQAKLTYIPLQGTFEIPLSIGLGLAYNSFSGGEKPSFLSLLATAEAGFSWYFTEDWGITLSSGLQLIPEIYGSNHPYSEHTTLAGFMPITLSVSYRSN